MDPKKIRKLKREGPIRIPLPFEEVIADVLKVKPEPGGLKKVSRRAAKTPRAKT
jgi:hypothetical protein